MNSGIVVQGQGCWGVGLKARGKPAQVLFLQAASTGTPSITRAASDGWCRSRDSTPRARVATRMSVGSEDFKSFGDGGQKRDSRHTSCSNSNSAGFGE